MKINYLYLKIVWSGFFAELKTGYNLFKFQNLELSLIKIKVFISYSYTKSINKIDLMIKNFDYNLIKKNIFCKRKNPITYITFVHRHQGRPHLVNPYMVTAGPKPVYDYFGG